MDLGGPHATKIYDHEYLCLRFQISSCISRLSASSRFREQSEAGTVLLFYPRSRPRVCASSPSTLIPSTYLAINAEYCTALNHVDQSAIVDGRMQRTGLRLNNRLQSAFA
jgi:hypothetical protein